MKRNELEIGGQYAGPEGRCYQIEDLSPGWRVNGAGEWVEDHSTRTRHMPGRGEMAYRANLSVKAYVIRPDGTRRKAVVDPRKLTEPWVEYELRKTAEKMGQVHSNRVLTLLRRNLRDYPGYRPAPAESYEVSPDGSSVRIPMKDLSALMDVAFGDRSGQRA